MTSHRYSADIDRLRCSWLDITNVCVRDMSELLGIIYSSVQFWIVLCAFICQVCVCLRTMSFLVIFDIMENVSVHL